MRCKEKLDWTESEILWVFSFSCDTINTNWILTHYAVHIWLWCSFCDLRIICRLERSIIRFKFNMCLYVLLAFYITFIDHSSEHSRIFKNEITHTITTPLVIWLTVKFTVMFTNSKRLKQWKLQKQHTKPMAQLRVQSHVHLCFVLYWIIFNDSVYRLAFNIIIHRWKKIKIQEKKHLFLSWTFNVYIP